MQKTKCIYNLSRRQIRLQIKRTVPRHLKKLNFGDRNVDDVTDGYVSCDSYKDNRDWKHVEKMERGMQAVPILVRVALLDLWLPTFNPRCQPELSLRSKIRVKVTFCTSPESRQELESSRGPVKEFFLVLSCRHHH